MEKVALHRGYDTFSKIGQAQSALQKHKSARESGQIVKPRGLTLEEWLTAWINEMLSLSRSITTVYTYQNIIHSHIIPALGNQPVQKITPHQLQTCYAELVRDKHLTAIPHGNTTPC